MGADKEAIAPETNQVAGTVKSTQGIYKGIIIGIPSKDKVRKK